MSDARLGSTRISVDQDRCCGSGMCTLTAPDVFDQRDSDGVVVVIQPAPRGEQLAAARKAINLCPSRAIAAQA